MFERVDRERLVRGGGGSTGRAGQAGGGEVVDEQEERERLMVGRWMMWMVGRCWMCGE